MVVGDEGGFLLPGDLAELLSETDPVKRRQLEAEYTRAHAPWSRWENMRYDTAGLVVRLARLIHPGAGRED